MMSDPAVKQRCQALIAAMRGLVGLDYTAERVPYNCEITNDIYYFVAQGFLVESQLLVGMKTSGSEHDRVL